jgi:hypothetical protein
VHRCDCPRRHDTPDIPGPALARHLRCCSRGAQSKPHRQDPSPRAPRHPRESGDLLGPVLGRGRRAVDGPRSGEATAVAATLSLPSPCAPKTERNTSKSPGRGAARRSARHLRCYSRGARSKLSRQGPSSPPPARLATPRAVIPARHVIPAKAGISCSLSRPLPPRFPPSRE